MNRVVLHALLQGLVLTACGAPPYDPYFPDAAAAPEITGIAPHTAGSLGGGETITISGERLGDTRTVVFGGRNAEIVEVADDHVTVVAPAHPTGGAVDVALATGGGIARDPGGFTYARPAGDFAAAEVASVALYVYDCPVEAHGNALGEDVPIFWCGLEAGFAHAVAQTGTGPGFAGDLSGFTPLSWLPAVGEVVVFGAGERRPPKQAWLYDPQPLDATVTVSTARDFARDLAFLEERLAALETRYSYWGDVSEVIGPYATLWDEDTCWIEDLAVLSGDGDGLVLDGDATGATGLWLGFAVEERFGPGEVYTTEAFTGTAAIAAAGGSVTGAASGAVLTYDDYSGGFQAAGVAGTIMGSDLPFSAVYDVGFRGEALGQVRGVARLETELDLGSGAVAIPRSEDLVVRWTPQTGDDPHPVAVEIVVYDATIAHPEGVAEIARLVAHGDDALGELVIPASELAKLPAAANRFGEDDLRGLWAELTISRHQLRKVAFAGGDMVLDFQHVVNGTVTLE